MRFSFRTRLVSGKRFLCDPPYFPSICSGNSRAKLYHDPPYTSYHIPPCTQSQTHPNSTVLPRAATSSLSSLLTPLSARAGRAAAHLTLPDVAAVVGEHERGADVVTESANLLLGEHALQHREDTLACRRVRRQGEDDGGGGGPRTQGSDALCLINCARS